MDSFITIRTIRLKENHGGDDIYISLNGEQLKESSFKDMFKNN
jgi:hypothetical protein